MGNVIITPMSVKGRVIHVVQTSPLQTWGTLWSSGISTGFVSGGRRFKPHDVTVSSFENNLIFSQIGPTSRGASRTQMVWRRKWFAKAKRRGFQTTATISQCGVAGRTAWTVQIILPLGRKRKVAMMKVAMHNQAVISEFNIALAAITSPECFAAL